tara:strand:- start:54 stop:449 length:396 start_codon:yes stop_codon:yes gene_type:complete
MFCKKCNSLMVNNYEDVYCPMCGYRDIIVADTLLITIEITKGVYKHYDLEKDKDLRYVSKWVKRCVGSGKIGKNLTEHSIICINCYKYLPPTKSGRVPKHVPMVWFAEKVLVLMNLARQKKKGLQNVRETK